MKKIIKYSEIEKITYQFGTTDIMDALLTFFGIEASRHIELELYEELDGKSQYAELIVTYKKDKPPQTTDSEKTGGN